MTRLCTAKKHIEEVKYMILKGIPILTSQIFKSVSPKSPIVGAKRRQKIAKT